MPTDVPPAPVPAKPTLLPAQREKLQTAWRERNLVFCLGAGVSLPYGLPSWNDLVLTLLLDEYPSYFKHLLAHYRRPFGSWLAETFGLTPMQLARLAHLRYKRRGFTKRFEEYVRDELFEQLQPVAEETAITAIADLLHQSENDHRHVQYVITLNFDDLLEQELERLQVPYRSIYGPDRREGEGLIILHPHGYLPRHKQVPDGELIFSEQEYHQLSYSSIHWAQVEMLSTLRCYTVVFVGLSMSDPNLRRFLDATAVEKRPPAHFLFRQSYSLTQVEKERAARTITDRVQAQVGADGKTPETADLVEFQQVIDRMLTVPTDYDEALFEDMGVEVIWYHKHTDVPHLLREIPTP